MLKLVKIPEIESDYAYKQIDRINRDFVVKINGQEVNCYQSRCSKVPFNRVYEGVQRNINQSEILGHLSFESDAPVFVEVQSMKPFSRALVRPLSKGVNVQTDKNVARFTLKNYGHYSLEFDDTHNSISMFFNPINDFSEKGHYTHYYGAGNHYVGIVNLSSGDKVYIDKDAVLYGGIYAKDADNILIEGYGTINGKCMERIDRGFFNCGNVKMENCKNVKINGPIMQDSAFWVASFFNCENIDIENIKITGQWRYNTDGIDLVNCKNVTIKNSYLHAFDDVISIKAYSQFGKASIETVENILVKDCVLWCDWGRTIEIGIETIAKEYKDIVFTNCDLIHNSASAIDIQNGNCALIHDIKIQNINVEFQTATMPEIYQESLDQEYDGYEKTGMPYLIWIDNHKYTVGVKQFSDLIEKYTDSKIFGMVKDVIIDNVNVYAEENLPKFKMKIFSHDEQNSFENIVVQNVFVNGKKADKKEFDLNIDDRIKNLSVFE